LQPADLEVTVRSPRSMIARCGLPTHYLLSAFWAGWRYSSNPTQPRRRDPGPSARGRERHRRTFVGTIRRELLDHTLIINQRHAAMALREYELYALDRNIIVLRMDPGTKLTAANHANVTFEVDEIDHRNRTGWSVLVRGLAEEVTSEHRDELIERTRASGVQPWAPGTHGHWMRLIPHGITGRRIARGELPPAFGPDAYL
jgi:hypothetical protein